MLEVCRMKPEHFPSLNSVMVYYYSGEGAAEPSLLRILEAAGIDYFEYTLRADHLPSGQAYPHPWCYTTAQLEALLDVQESELRRRYLAGRTKRNLAKKRRAARRFEMGLSAVRYLLAHDAI